MYEVENINIKGCIFGIDYFESKSGYKIITLKVTDYTDSIYVKMFTKDDDEFGLIKKLLKENKERRRIIVRRSLKFQRVLR